VESFLCAGSSALLISAAHVFPELWFFSLFALVPLLWRAIRGNLLESGILGGMLAVSYAFVAFRIESWASLGNHLIALASLIFLFAIYSALVNRISKHLGFNAIFIAALWLPLEYTMSHWVNPVCIFPVSLNESNLVLRFGSLFGLLMVSFVIVVVNALILISVRRIAQELQSRDSHTIPDHNYAFAPFGKLYLERNWYSFPDVRAPPTAPPV
jgi:apolipoprotein N-acyltransferase